MFYKNVLKIFVKKNQYSLDGYFLYGYILPIYTIQFFKTSKVQIFHFVNSSTQFVSLQFFSKFGIIFFFLFIYNMAIINQFFLYIFFGGGDENLGYVLVLSFKEHSSNVFTYNKMSVLPLPILGLYIFYKSFTSLAIL